MPEYLEALAEELRIRADVENEIADHLAPLLHEAGEVLGDDALLRAVRPHAEAEVGRRLRDAQLDRKRAGLR